MNSYSLELYSHSIYCSPAKQAQPRPVSWYSTRSFEDDLITKFRWVSFPEIVCEISFQSIHTPLCGGLGDTYAVSKNLPLGVASFQSENKLFWHNCALAYLRKHIAAIAKVEKLKGYKRSCPSNEYYDQLLSDAKRDCDDLRTKFRLCNRWKRKTYGLSHDSMSEQILKSITAFKLLEHSYKHIQHNVVLVGNCIECFLLNGFFKLSQYTFAKQPDESEFKYLFRLVIAYLKERCSKDPDCFMAFRNSFGRYGALKELDPFFKLEGVPDLKPKFDHL
ncbi:hypothetical protein [Vibrio cholerae]|uniref:hypothetical protein n=1 Tax=Vibrio cholerae TaxID=666 RepID=UPI00308071DC